MKKKLAKLLVLTLIWSVLLGLTPAAQAAGSKTMRIGLLSGNDAAASVKLANVAGAGFRFGYYDSDLRFVSLGWTQETAIQVMITHNLYLNGSGSFVHGAENNRGIAVGCYHLHLSWPYQDFASAQAAAQQAGGFVAWINGAYYVRIGSYTSRADAEVAAAAMGAEGVVVGETSSYGYTVVAAGTNRILFQFDSKVAGEAGAFAVRPGLEDGMDTITQFNGGNKYRGGFRLERIGGGSSTVVNVVELEDCVKGVICYEMSNSWPLEALKAQAVCARTYAMRNTRHSNYHFDLCTTTDCQVYRGTGGAGENSDRAVEETAGQLARYNGSLIEAVYYSSNGGGTEDVKNVWGSSHDYLKGKLDPYEADIADRAGNYKWSKTLTAAELKSKLKAKGYACGDIATVTTKLSESGNVIELQFIDVAGKSFTISRGDRVRSFLGTNSIRFSVTGAGGTQQSAGGYAVAGADNASGLDTLYALSGDGTVAALPSQSYIVTASGVKALEPAAGTSTTATSATSYTFTGTGWGHNVGMSQWGAYAMAKRGYTYLDILTFYYTGITVE